MKITPIATMALAIISCVQAIAAVPEYSAVVVKTYPHAAGAFTEGLLYHNGFLYESTGLAGQSSIRKERLETGEVVQQVAIDPKYFGEGIVIWKDKLIELTWQSQIGFIYDLATFARRGDFHYSGEGWALTQNGRDLIMSDGTSDLRLLDPDSLNETGRLHVTCDGISIRNINELEWVKGEIYANIWLTNVIVRINPATGKVVGLIDLTDLAAPTANGPPDDVLNGIAYDAAADRLFVTGKLWPKLYQITLSQRPHGNDLCRRLPSAANPK
jgi:glutaminyl-peptide cyclotransferase